MPENQVENRDESKKFINLGVVLNEAGEVLMIKRNKVEEGKGGSTLTWAFPGGKQRFSESREECVKREVLAETGYAVEPMKQIDLNFHPQFPVMIVYHLCRLSSPEPVAAPSEPHEVAEVRWVKPADIKGLINTALNPKVAKELEI